jgi:hypothetical protein
VQVSPSESGELAILGPETLNGMLVVNRHQLQRLLAACYRNRRSEGDLLQGAAGEAAVPGQSFQNVDARRLGGGRESKTERPTDRNQKRVRGFNPGVKTAQLSVVAQLLVSRKTLLKIPPLWSCDKERRISDNKAFVFMTGSEGDVSGAAARLVTRKEEILLTTLLSL